MTAAGCPSAATSSPSAASVGCAGGEDGEVGGPRTVDALADSGDESADADGGGDCGESAASVVDGAELLPRRRFPWDDAPEYGKIFSLFLFPFLSSSQ